METVNKLLYNVINDADTENSKDTSQSLSLKRTSTKIWNNETVVTPKNSTVVSVFDSRTGKKLIVQQCPGALAYDSSKDSDRNTSCSLYTITSSETGIEPNTYEKGIKCSGKEQPYLSTNDEVKKSNSTKDILLKSFELRHDVQNNSKTPVVRADVSTNVGDWSLSLKDKFIDTTKEIRDNTGESSIITPGKIVEYLPKNICSSDLRELNQSWENPVIGVNNQFGLPSVVESKSVLSRQSFDRVYSTFSFHKDMFKDVQVLGQADDKFIACVFATDCDKMLVLVDQHAAHERIRLEKLLKQINYYSQKEKSANYRPIKNQITRLSPPAEVLFYTNEIDLFLHYGKEFSEIGLNFSVMKSISSSTKKVFISSVPSVFVNVCNIQLEARGSVVNSDLIKEFMQEQVRFMRATRGKCNLSSTVIFKVLASHACHGAIRFGDKLSFETCANVIKELSKCDLPFQCAHGRPSIAPLMKLEILGSILDRNSQHKSPNLAKLKFGKCLQGLG